MGSVGPDEDVENVGCWLTGSVARDEDVDNVGCWLNVLAKIFPFAAKTIAPAMKITNMETIRDTAKRGIPRFLGLARGL